MKHILIKNCISCPYLEEYKIPTRHICTHPLLYGMRINNVNIINSECKLEDIIENTYLFQFPVIDFNLHIPTETK